MEQNRFLFQHFGGVMRRDRESEGNNENKNEVRVELKYCERCGGLWLRECGTGGVYCGSCQLIVADLPIPKKPQRVTLPVRRASVLDDYSFENGDDDSLDFEAAGEVTGGAA
jgi:hypothetical protein